MSTAHVKFSWKVMDFSEFTNTDDCYLPGSARDDIFSSEVIKECFRRMKNKWEKPLSLAIFGKRKEYMVISGGHVSFYYILPGLIAKLKRESNFTPIKAIHIEASNDIALNISDIRCGVKEKNTNQMYHCGRIYTEKAYACVNRSIKKEKEWLVISGRPVADHGIAVADGGIYFAHYYYNVQEDFGSADFLADQFFISFESVAHSVGVGLVLDCVMKGRRKSFVKIKGPKYTVERCIIKDKRIKHSLSIK